MDRWNEEEPEVWATEPEDECPDWLYEVGRELGDLDVEDLRELVDME